MKKVSPYGLLLLALTTIMLSGCGSSHLLNSKISVDTGPMNRNDYIVLDTVKGEAERISILFGLIQIIDGDKKKILWIPFYNEKYSYAFEGVASMENRAYHNALGQIPDADSVISTRYQKETGGLPILFRTEKVTFTGKAVKIKTDAEKERGMD